MKSQVSTTEMILVSILLFIAFTVLFPKFSYKTKWDDAYLVLKGRDILSTVDNIGRVYVYSFSPQNFETGFLSKTIQQDIIASSQTEDTAKNEIFVACSCTNNQINYLSSQLSDIRINDRSIKINYCYTDLNKINPCSAKITYPDALIIWGYNDLTPYESNLKDLIDRGNAVIEITDFDNSVDIDATKHKKIFGIDSGTGWAAVDYDTIPKPDNAMEIKYQPYKFFYHAPLPLKAIEEGLKIGCTKNMTGIFKLWSTNYVFAICDGTTVQFDSESDGRLNSDTFEKGDTFSLIGPIGTYSFTLNYVQENGIDVSFKPAYNFDDFCRIPSKKKIEPSDGEIGRAFIYAVKGVNIRAYCTILNETSGKTAWLPYLDTSSIGDDHRQLLLSLILSLSNKKPKEQLDMGTVTSLVNVNNTDIFEVYKFNLGLKHPF